MTVMPTWDQFMSPVLTVMSDGAVRGIREIRTAAAQAERLTEAQLDELLPSGQRKAENRIGWAVSYLTRVGALQRPTRGQYSITDGGRQLLAAHPQGITELDLRLLVRAGDEWWIQKGSSNRSLADGHSLVDNGTIATLDPVEQIEQGIERIHAEVAADLLARLHAQAPAFFEQAVLDLLIAMGYGGAEGRATRTQLTNDSGIDGIIDQDALGLSRIYVQAKRYALDSSVQRPEIQGFVGALHGNKAGQGVFITTARFSGGAQTYAKEVPTPVVLIDGPRLASLMIRYGVGVQVRRTVALVEVDEDFFE
ncbi:MAG TPA: restriction endonuclease [Propionibacteriaceae bacterium]